VIYLKKDLSKLKQRIAMRGRSYEQNIPDEYLINLNRYYDDWMKNYSLGKKLIIDSDELDFVKNSSDFDSIASRIVSALDQRDLFLEQTGLRVAHQLK
jgi:deoxyadenosine/deoxycytidine kinase